MLTAQLRELEVDGLVVRTVYAEVPPKVEYALSDLGRSLEPVIDGLKAWGRHHLHLFARRPGPERIDEAAARRIGSGPPGAAGG